jgi:hypothetical protein
MVGIIITASSDELLSSSDGLLGVASPSDELLSPPGITAPSDELLSSPGVTSPAEELSPPGGTGITGPELLLVSWAPPPPEDELRTGGVYMESVSLSPLQAKKKSGNATINAALARIWFRRFIPAPGLGV